MFGSTVYDYEILHTVMEQLDKYDPINVGLSGQIKEFREEKHYGDIGEYHHRHISHLVGAYPGVLINKNTPELLKAAEEIAELHKSMYFWILKMK